MTLISKTALALAALLGTATVASAENTFVFNRDNNAPGVINLRGVEAEQAGSIDVFGVADGGSLTFLGSTPIAAGLTSDVAVTVPAAQQDRLTIYMMNGNRNVATLNVRDLAAG